MKFDRLALRNFKCYTDVDLLLDPGVTVIHGPNGAGKSTLLEACFFGLYGHRALDRTLEEVVASGTDSAAVELWFSHGGGQYHITREIKVRDGGAQTTTCLLESPTQTVDGARQVRESVTELLRMDSDAFVNCAYVRQGEVNKLINASPSQRQDMIDELLQLGKLERYRERAVEARLGVKHVKDGREAVLESTADEIDQKESAGLYKRLNDLETSLKETESEIEDIRSKRPPAEQALQDAESVLADYRSAQEEIAELESAIDRITAAIQERETKRSTLAEEISAEKQTIAQTTQQLEVQLDATSLDTGGSAELSARSASLETRKERLQAHKSELVASRRVAARNAEAARERATELSAEASDRRSDAEERAAELAEQRETLEERRGSLSEVAADRATLAERFEDADRTPEETEDRREELLESRSQARERVAELRSALAASEESLADAEALQEAGKCPRCGQPVENSPHVAALTEHRERVAELESNLEEATERASELERALETAKAWVERAGELSELDGRIETLQTLIDEREAELDQRERAVAELRSQAATLDEDAEAARKEATTAERRGAALEERIDAVGEDIADLEERLARLERIERLSAAVDESETEIDQLRTRRATLQDQVEVRSERLAEKRARKRELADQYDQQQVAKAKQEKQRATAYLERVDESIEQLRSKENELRDSLGGVRGEIDRLESLRDRHDSLETTVGQLQSLYEETEELQRMYGDLRGQLRQQNVERLGVLLNETFDLLYQNDSYARIELGPEYGLTVFQKDGEPLAPDQLSGGERAIFNLALRCGIYRLLAEGIDGETPMPPLILDEPTMFLDSGHVLKLVDLIDAMRGFGVEQILVVSHDEDLVEAADDLVTVEKNTTSNRAAVAHTGGPTQAERSMLADTSD